MHHSHHHQKHYHHGSKVKGRDSDRKPTSRNYVLRSLVDDFTELNFTSSRSPSLKNLPPKTVGMTSNGELKRGSVYQSSEVVRKMKNLQVEGTWKMQHPCSSDTLLSFMTMDLPLPLTYQNEPSPVAQRRRPPLNSVSIYLDSESLSTTSSACDSSDFQDLSFDLPEQYLKGFHICPGTVAASDGSHESFLEICIHSKDTECCCTENNAELVERSSMEETKLDFDGTFYPKRDGNGLLEIAAVFALPKSSPTKLITASLPCESKNNKLKASSKVLSNPFRRILNPIIKSTSLWDLPTSATKIGWPTISSPARIKTTSLHKSSVQELSKTIQNANLDGKLGMKDSGLVTSASPAHLHGLLRLAFKHGVPFFQFLLKGSEDILAAKTWRTDNAFKWVYTFHSANSKRKSSSGIWGKKDGHKQSTIVAQMQASSYLCSEVSSHGSHDNSVVTEFVLFDIARGRKSIPSIRNLEPEKCEAPSRHEFGHSDFDADAPYCWVPPSLYPHLEVAAMVIRFPFEKRESLKGKPKDEGLGGKESPNLFSFSSLDRTRDAFPSNANYMDVKVVIPSGIHGLPSDEEGGPSPLLDRWRSDGVCDCGGWDMACPIIVFDSCSLRNGAGSPPMEIQRPLELFVQGGIEKVPALTMTMIDEGVYSVDFHARLSSIQAFSICVGILRGAEVSTAVGQERNRQRLHCKSLKVLLGEEMRCLIEAVADEDRRKTAKKIEEIPPTFVLDPPVSSIGRV